jgi:hypothetical protein
MADLVNPHHIDVSNYLETGKERKNTKPSTKKYENEFQVV